MTEQVMGVISAEVDTQNRRIVRTGTLGAETSGASSEGHKVRWSLKGATGQERFIEGGRKTLTERINEAYDEEARREDEEFLRVTKSYYRRRLIAED